MFKDLDSTKTAIQGNAVMRFLGIPEPYRNEETALLWLDSISGKLAGIPRTLWNKEVLKAGILASPDSIKDLDPFETPDYEDLAKSALLRSAAAIRHVAAHIVTHEFMVDVVRISPKVLVSLQYYNLHGHLLGNQELIDIAVKRSLSVAADLRNISVKDECVETRVRANPMDIILLPRLGKLDVLTKMVAEGYWPKKNEMHLNRKPGKRPSSVRESAEAAMRYTGTSVELLHIAFLRTQPPETVFNVLVDEPYRPLLLKALSSEQIRSQTSDKCILKLLVCKDFDI